MTVCAAVEPDLVLMDVHLPGIDGAEATRRLRSREAPPVVLLLSTHDTDSGEGLVAESGAAGYVITSELGPARLAAAWANAVG